MGQEDTAPAARRQVGAHADTGSPAPPQALVVAEQPPSPAPEALAPDSWARVLLARVQSGDTIDEARERAGSRVSRDTIARYGLQYPAWYRALMDAQEGTVSGSPVQPRDVARARATAVVDRMAELAMGAAKHDRDAIGAGRLVLEVAEAVGGGRQAPTVAVQVNVANRAPWPTREPAPTPTQAQTGAGG